MKDSACIPGCRSSITFVIRGPVIHENIVSAQKDFKESRSCPKPVWRYTGECGGSVPKSRLCLAIVYVPEERAGGRLVLRQQICGNEGKPREGP